VNCTAPSDTIADEDLRIVVLILANVTNCESSDQWAFTKAKSVFVNIDS
jgi:hypothetical protein